MKIVALDPSLGCTGWAKYDDGLITLGKIETKPPSGPARLVQIRTQVHFLCKDANLVLIESYSYGSKNQAHQLGELGGVLRVYFLEQGLDYVDVPPSTRMKYATGKGQATKESVLAEAIRRFGYQGASTDEADALVLLHVGMALKGCPEAIAVPKAHMEALKVVQQAMKGAA